MSASFWVNSVTSFHLLFLIKIIKNPGSKFSFPWCLFLRNFVVAILSNSKQWPTQSLQWIYIIWERSAEERREQQQRELRIPPPLTRGPGCRLSRGQQFLTGILILFGFFFFFFGVILGEFCCCSVIVEALKVDSLQRLCSSLEPLLRRIVSCLI